MAADEGIKKSGSGLPPDRGVSGEASGAWGIDTPATDLHGLLHLAISVSKEWLDKSVGLGVYFDYARKWGKLLAGGKNATSEFDSYLIGLKFWREIRRKIYLNDDGSVSSSINSISDRFFGVGWNSYGASREVGGQTYIEAQYEKWPVMQFGSSTGYGWQAMVGGRVFIEPYIKFRSATSVFLIDNDRLGTQAGSPTDIGLEFGFRIGDGGASEEPSADKPPTFYDDLYDTLGDALELIQRGSALRQNIEAGKGGALIDGSGTTDSGGGSEENPSMMMISKLRVFQTAMSGLGYSNFIESTNAEYKGGSRAVYGIRVGARAVAGLASTVGGFVLGRGGGGESLTADGITDLSMAAGALLSMADIKGYWQLIIRAIPGAIIQPLGHYVDNKGFGAGGLNILVGNFLATPAEITSSREISAGYEGTITGDGGHGTYVQIRNHIDAGSDRHKPFVGVKVVANVAGAVENIVTGGERMDVPLSGLTILRTGAGFKEAIPLKKGTAELGISAEVYAAQQFGPGVTTGGGAALTPSLRFDANKVRIGIEGTVGVEKMHGRRTRAYGGGGLIIEF